MAVMLNIPFKSQSTYTPETSFRIFFNPLLLKIKIFPTGIEKTKAFLYIPERSDECYLFWDCFKIKLCLCLDTCFAASTWWQIRCEKPLQATEAEWLCSSVTVILQAVLLTLKSFLPERPLLDGARWNSEGFTGEAQQQNKQEEPPERGIIYSQSKSFSCGWKTLPVLQHSVQPQENSQEWRKSVMSSPTLYLEVKKKTSKEENTVMGGWGGLWCKPQDLSS